MARLISKYYSKVDECLYVEQSIPMPININIDIPIDIDSTPMMTENESHPEMPPKVQIYNPKKHRKAVYPEEVSKTNGRTIKVLKKESKNPLI